MADAPVPPSIVPSAPIVVPSKSYDKYWVTSISISASSPKAEAMAVLSLIPYISTTGEIGPVSLGFSLQIPGIFARIKAGDTELAQIMGLILDYADKEAKKQGKIS